MEEVQKRSRKKAVEIEDGETRESVARKEQAELVKEHKESNKLVTVWYEVKYGKKLIEVTEKKSGAKYRKFVCNILKPSGKEYLDLLKSKNAIIKGL